MENVPKIKKKVNWEKIGIYKVVVLDELIIFAFHASSLETEKCVFCRNAYF
jgi:hypothetical protein